MYFFFKFLLLNNNFYYNFIIIIIIIINRYRLCNYYGFLYMYLYLCLIISEQIIYIAINYKCYNSFIFWMKIMILLLHNYKSEQQCDSKNKILMLKCCENKKRDIFECTITIAWCIIFRYIWLKCLIYIRWKLNFIIYKHRQSIFNK